VSFLSGRVPQWEGEKRTRQGTGLPASYLFQPFFPGAAKEQKEKERALGSREIRGAITKGGEGEKSSRTEEEELLNINVKFTRGKFCLAQLGGERKNAGRKGNWQGNSGPDSDRNDRRDRFGRALRKRGEVRPNSGELILGSI